MNTKVTIIYPTDPMYPKVGGVATLIKVFIKYAPKDFDIEFIGTSSDISRCPLKKWMKLSVEGRDIQFAALVHEKDENIKTKIPLSFRFTMALANFRHDYSDKLLFIHTIEPAVLFLRAKCPKILVIHNDMEKMIVKAEGEVLWGKFPWLYFLFEKMIMPSIDRVYTESWNTVSFYHKKYAPMKDKFSFLPTWADARLFSRNGEPKDSLRKRLCANGLSAPINAQWIVFTGRLEKQKNPIRMIDVFFKYQLQNPHSALLLIGGGNMRAEIVEHINKLGLQQKVFMLQEKKQLDLVDFYRAADVFLLTSNYEGMSVSILEALACGLPVVSTDTGETKLVVKSRFSGEIAGNNSPETLARCLEAVLKEPGVYSGENCLKAVSEYTAENVLNSLCETMRQLYRNKRAA